MLLQALWFHSIAIFNRLMRCSTFQLSSQRRFFPYSKKIIPSEWMCFYNTGKRLSLQNLLTGTCFSECFLNHQVISAYCNPPPVLFKPTIWCEESMLEWKWYHSRRGNGIQCGPVWRVMLIRRTKALKGNSPLSASWCIASQERKQQYGTAPKKRAAGSSWGRKGKSTGNLLCWAWKGGAEGFFLTSTKKESLPFFLKHVEPT